MSGFTEAPHHVGGAGGVTHCDRGHDTPITGYYACSLMREEMELQLPVKVEHHISAAKIQKVEIGHKNYWSNGSSLFPYE